MSADPEPIRTAACSCGQLRASCTGEPVRLSMCHCLECQKRTGSPFGVQARFPRAQVRIAGTESEFTRTGEQGNVITLRFCPTCGSTLYWTMSTQPDLVRRRRQLRRSRVPGAQRLRVREAPPSLGRSAGSSADAAAADAVGRA